MLSRCMTGKWRALAGEKVLGFYNNSRAHLHSPACRTIVIKVPREDDECSNGHAVLDKAMYGTKDAAQCFDVASENAMIAMGYDTDKFSPNEFHSSSVAMSVFRHGDDVVVSGTRTQQKEFEEQLSKHLIVKHLATLGSCTALGEVTEVRIANRIVRWVKPPYGSGRERIEYEADPRHAELIIHQLGLSCSSRSVSEPGEKPKPGVDTSSFLNSADHSLYRSATMRLCYLALDRLDLQFPSKELARWMQAPTVGNLEALKRVARYLIIHGWCDKSRNRLTLWCLLTQITQVVCKHATAHLHQNCCMVPT